MGRDGSKGKGRGRGGGGGRGGGRKMYIDNEDELAIRDRQIDEQRKATARRRAGSDDEEGEEGGEGEDTVFGFAEKGSLEEGVEKLNVGDEPQLGYQGDLGGAGAASNPNHNRKIVAPAMGKVKNLGSDSTAPVDAEAGMNRKEREALAAQKAKEDYMRRHMAGQTEEAKKQLAQLAIVRARREAAKAKREAEGRAPGMSATGLPDGDEDSSSDDDSSDDDGMGGAPKAKGGKGKAAAPVPTTGAAGAEYRAQQAKKEANEKKKEAVLAAEKEAAKAGAADGPPKLKAMDIKKMNGDALKDALKERELPYQGSKKDLMQRLIDFEAKR